MSMPSRGHGSANQTANGRNGECHEVAKEDSQGFGSGWDRKKDRSERTAEKYSAQRSKFRICGTRGQHHSCSGAFSGRVNGYCPDPGLKPWAILFSHFVATAISPYCKYGRCASWLPDSGSSSLNFSNSCTPLSNATAIHRNHHRSQSRDWRGHRAEGRSIRISDRDQLR
jgi:hypothetical protein